MARLRAMMRSNWPVLVCVLVVLAGRSSLADHYIVPSGSMEPTLVPGDRVLVDKMSFGIRLPFSEIVIIEGETPRAGEVVIFDSPEDGVRLIKRVVACFACDQGFYLDGYRYVSDDPLDVDLAPSDAKVSAEDSDPAL